MKPVGMLVLVAGALAALTVGSGAAAPPTLLAVVGHGRAARLATVDPTTLRPVGRSTQVGYYQWPWTRSPDGSRIALVRDPARIRIVDVKRMRTVSAFSLQGSVVDAIAWVRPRLIMAVLGEYAVVGVDPVAKRVVWSRPLPGMLSSVEPTADGFVLLLEAVPVDGKNVSGPTPLVTVGADGKVRSVVLDRIRSSSTAHSEPPPTSEYRRPGLAVDVAGNRAYVVGAGEPVAAIDLASLGVSYHGGSRVLAKAVNGPERHAVWIGNGLFAVTGVDAHATTTPGGDEHWWYTPAGLSVVDTHDWSWSPIDPNATSVLVAGDELLATAWLYDSTGPTVTGIGVAAYTLDGAPRFHVLGNAVVDLYAAAGRVYAVGDGVTVIDSATGKIVHAVVRPAVFPLTGF